MIPVSLHPLSDLVEIVCCRLACVETCALVHSCAVVRSCAVGASDLQNLAADSGKSSIFNVWHAINSVFFMTAIFFLVACVWFSGKGARLLTLRLTYTSLQKRIKLYCFCFFPPQVHQTRCKIESTWLLLTWLRPCEHKDLCWLRSPCYQHYIFTGKHWITWPFLGLCLESVDAHAPSVPSSNSTPELITCCLFLSKA